MRNIARIEPIINLLVSSWRFEAELLDWWKKWPDIRLSQYLINEWIIEEDRNIYNFYDECWVTMEKLWFQWRDFAIRGSHGKNWKWKLQYKVIKDMSNEHVANVVEHVKEQIEKYNKLEPIEKYIHWTPKYSENQLRKRVWEDNIRKISELEEWTIIKLDWRWPCYSTNTIWKFIDYYDKVEFNLYSPESFATITEEQAGKETEDMINSIHWSRR